jgi:hypothetical protein
MNSNTHTDTIELGTCPNCQYEFGTIEWKRDYDFINRAIEKSAHEMDKFIKSEVDSRINALTK